MSEEPGHKVVITHEWLTNIAGSEKVFKVMAEMYPHAELIVGIADPATARALLPGRRVKALLSHRLPYVRSHWHLYGPVLLLLWRFKRVDADLLLVSSHFAAHQVCRRARARKIVYYHSPMRIAWRWDLERGRLHASLRRAFGRLVRPALMSIDRSAASAATLPLANSHETASRIERFYHRKALVVYPPVSAPSEDEFDSRIVPEHPYYLVLGRLVPYKRVDLAIQACNSLKRALVIAGDGPEFQRLSTLGDSTVQMLGRVTEAQKNALLRGASALLFPGEEDFGIVPVEALANGTPVVAYKKGGALDTIHPGVGEFFDEPTPESLASAIISLERRRFVADELRSHAATFGQNAFQESLRAVVGC